MLLKKEIRIGLTLVSALTIFYLALTWLSRTQLFAPEEKYYHINFENVNGLLEGDPVLIRGYTSGRVLSISPEATFVKVDIALDSKIRLYEDAEAEIQIKELMGGKQIAIETGSFGGELLAGEELKGKIALDFSSGFSQFGQIAEGVDVSRLSSILNRADSLMQSFQAVVQQMEPKRIDRAFSQTERALEHLNQTLYKLNAQVDFRKIDSLMDSAGEGLQKGTQLIEHADKLMARIDQNSLGPVEESLKEMPELIESLKLGIGNLNKISHQLSDTRSLAGRLMTDEKLSRSLDTTLHNLNKTLELIHSKKVIVGFRKKRKDR